MYIQWSCVQILHTVKLCADMYTQWSCVQILHTVEFDLSRKKNEIMHVRIIVGGTGG